MPRNRGVPVLGNRISQKRIETFILTCIDALGHIETTNYHVFLREIGDAVLLLFSSFEDAYEWWVTMHSWLYGRNNLWISDLGLSQSERKHFRLETKTIIHAGEVSYSGSNTPLSAAVNQVFKAEKTFKANELGITHHALSCAKPLLRQMRLSAHRRCEITLPGDKEPIGVYLIDTYDRAVSRHQKAIKEERRQYGKSSLRSKTRG